MVSLGGCGVFSVVPGHARFNRYEIASSIGDLPPTLSTVFSHLSIDNFETKKHPSNSNYP
jgi:hypothetical protein